MAGKTRRRSGAVLLCAALALPAVGCSSSSADTDDADSMSAMVGTWVDEGNSVKKVVITDEGRTFQAFRDMEATDLYTEGTCVPDEEWTDDAGDTWSLATCTHSNGEVYCSLARVSADGSVWEWKHSRTDCPEDLDAGFMHYERAES